MMQAVRFTLPVWIFAAILGLGVAAAIQRMCTPTLLATGKFHPVAHKGSGTVSLYRLRDGRRVLRFYELKTARRPDLAVYLVAAKDALDNESVLQAGFRSLGKLGDCVYQVPAGVNLRKYRAVTIWSMKYQVNFTTAPLR